ncbi:hypothetical protein SRB5_18740 [Streptomyces sp. RB5]|uniref:Amidohydrolase-related domain-containing protein n=1 Tax=Streptomyces smaragdinus TaxID=2585196 RepID=A0A7K0CE58_9ACTN|nr:amidohydrolase family protein [Streptomyces smaragdinus]MQY11755.1 hypothetical protein [Streptomyces smaragdinus]
MSDRHDVTGDGPVPTTDIHAHAMPLPLLRDLQARGLADLGPLPAGVVHLDAAVSGLAPGAPIPYPVTQYDLDSRLERMDAAGIDVQAVSAPPFLFASCCGDDRLAMDVVRRSNDAIAEFVAAAPTRMVGLATVPVGLPGAAEELDRCLTGLGFAGATAGTYGGGAELDAPVNEELWGALARRRCFVLLHPSRVSSGERLRDYHLAQLLGYPAETALAVARLVMGGVLDRHELVMCLAHGGGCAPGVSSRLDLGWERKPVARVSEQPPASYLSRFLFDTAVFSGVGLGRLVEDFSAGNILLGTDFPFDLEDRDPVGTVSALGLPPDQHKAILGGNAMALLPGITPTDLSTVGAAPGRPHPHREGRT